MEKDCNCREKFLLPFSIDSADFPCIEPSISSPHSFYGQNICSVTIGKEKKIVFSNFVLTFPCSNVISKILQILGIWPRISKVFLNHYHNFFLTTCQNNFRKKICIIKSFLQNNDEFIFFSYRKPGPTEVFVSEMCRWAKGNFYEFFKIFTRRKSHEDLWSDNTWRVEPVKIWSSGRVSKSICANL